MTGAAAARSIVLVACVAIACARGDSRSGSSDSATRGTGSVSTADSGARGAASGDSLTANAGAPPPCVSAGAWQACSVEKRLTDAGFVPQKQDAPAADLFPVQGTEYTLGPARLHVYVFPSAAEREAAVATIDTVAIARRGTPAQWGAPAWLITSNNLVAVLVSDNARLVERVQLALTAGLPSATS